MIINDTVKEDVLNKFKFIHASKEDSKALNKAAIEMLKTLAEILKVDKSVVKEAFIDWQDEEKKKNKTEGRELSLALGVVE